MADVVCRRGNRAAAVRLEELCNGMIAGRPIAVMCGYALETFDDDATASQLRAICGQHTHVSPTEAFTDGPDDRTRLEQITLLQQRARALDHMLAAERSPLSAIDAATATVYIVDDDGSVRRSLARLLTSVDMHVRTFSSAEAFLRDVDEKSSGCLIVDVQLLGMSGSDLQDRMARADWPMPIIAMSGSHDSQVEADALRLGATAFLHKPFDAQALIDAIARALP
jgi:CheY-like chemotaxis protein